MSFLIWFKGLKRENRIILIACSIIIIIIIFFSIKLYFAERQLNRELKSQLNELTKKEEIYLKDIKTLKSDKNDLKEYSDKVVADYEKLKSKLKPIKDEGKKIPDNVKSYPDRKLDSVLTNYRHIKRTEN